VAVNEAGDQRSDDDDAAGQASATMRGNAGEVHLFQYNRLSDQVADAEFTGDRAVLSNWLARSALWPRRYGP
jgi:hypothetical protein